MSWIRDTDGNLVNLEDVRKIEMNETDQKNDPETAFGVFAYSMQDADDDQPSYTLKVGNAINCKQFLEALTGKLPVVKL